MPDAATTSPTGASFGRWSGDDGPVLWLDDPRATEPAITGAKAANLARAAVGGLPVLPGFVLTTAATASDAPSGEALEAAREAYGRLTAGTADPMVVVRSSSTAEDMSTSSMAGQFTSVLDVTGWPAVAAAIEAVVRSASRPKSGDGVVRPMAVLVQPQLTPPCGGVLFGLDPVSGDTHHLVVEALPGGPDALVSGTATATHAVLSKHGHLHSGRRDPARELLDGRRRRQLARLARGAARVFGRPQDVEWAFDDQDRLWLLQSRDVTASGVAALAAGPVLGPGPVAETFPDPLRRLEVELWLEPLRQGVTAAIAITGAVSSRRLASSPVVTAVGGRAAADLELFGILPATSSLPRVLNPLRGGRRLLAAWRVGRLRSALPGLIDDLLAQVDEDLAHAPAPRDLETVELLDILDRCILELIALHGHEVLAGMLLAPSPDRPSLPALAVDALARARRAGLADAEAIERSPVLLSLLPPTIGGRATLPPTADPIATGRGGLDQLGPRDALRLRCRWTQELAARAAIELGWRLAAAGLLDAEAEVVHLSVADLRAAVADARRPAPAPGWAPGPPLPVAFRLGPRDEPVALDTGGGRRDGLGAGGGRGAGVVRHGDRDPAEEGVVLVVDVLDPRLAAVLGGLAGLVSETGSSLSHLAILAREAGVPTVVAVPDARRRYPQGARVLVDGHTGEVSVLDDGGGT